jgi:hypothetical protein
MRDVAHTSTQVDRIVDDVKKLTDKVDRMDRTIDRFKTSMIVVSLCLGLFLPAIGGMFWWAVGERLNSVLKPQTVTSTVTPSAAPLPC